MTAPHRTYSFKAPSPVPGIWGFAFSGVAGFTLYAPPVLRILMTAIALAKAVGGGGPVHHSLIKRRWMLHTDLFMGHGVLPFECSLAGMI